MLTALALAASLTVQDYATMPQLSAPRWSPDAKQIAYVVTTADLTRSVYDADIWVIGADGRDGRRLTYSPATDNAPRWSPDGSQLAFLSERDGIAAIYLMDARGGEARKLTSEPAAIQLFEWAPDGKSIAFTRADEQSAEEAKRIKERDDARVHGEGQRYMNLHVIDVATGRSRLLAEGGWYVNSFGWSPDSATIAMSASRRWGLDGRFFSDIYLVPASGGAARALVAQPGVDIRPQFSPDGRTIAFAGNGGEHDWLRELALFVVDVSGGTPREVSAAYGRSPEDFAWSADGRSILFEGPAEIGVNLYRVSRDGSGMKKVSAAEGVFRDADYAGSRAAYVFESLTSPPELHVDGKQVTHHSDALRRRTIGETRVIRWKNPKDGLEIEGLLTLPPGYAGGGRLPLLTFVHGGPASRFDLGYLGYLGHVYAPHAMAAQGFAVLRPNPRGTGGYGLAFRQGNRSDWANMPWLDINSGIDHVIALGIADETRLGLMGWSYGGYMATWALGHSDRFRAISIGAPVVDLMSHHGTSDIPGFIPSYFPGMPHDLLIAQSPLWQLKKSNTKVLIQHGDADDRVPPGQSMMLYRELERLGVEVTLVMYPRTPHIPREPKLRIDVARRNLEFFTKHIGTRTGAED